MRLRQRSILAAALAFVGAPGVDAILRFSCSELVTERLDPSVSQWTLGYFHEGQHPPN